MPILDSNWTHSTQHIPAPTKLNRILSSPYHHHVTRHERSQLSNCPARAPKRVEVTSVRPGLHRCPQDAKVVWFDFSQCKRIISPGACAREGLCWATGAEVQDSQVGQIGGLAANCCDCPPGGTDHTILSHFKILFSWKPWVCLNEEL